MRDEDDAQAVTATLWRKMLERGPGTIKRTEESIGVAADSLRAAKNSKHGLRLWHVTEAVKALGIPLPVFFDEAIGGIATTALDRFMARGAELAASNLVDLPELGSVTTPDRLTENDLSGLDALRFEAPRAAAEQAAEIARQAARDGRRGDAVAAVARQGSALRVAEEWEGAWTCIWWSLVHAPDRPTRADASLRSGSVVSDFGEFEQAATLAQDSAFLFLELADLTKTAKALVSRGIFLRYDEQCVQSTQVLAAALELLPASETLNRFAAHQCSAMAFIATRDLERASSHAAKAAAFAPKSSAFRADLHWLRARLANAQGNQTEAIRQYRLLCGELAASSANAALAKAELCRALHQAGEVEAAIRTAIDAASLAMPKNQNRVVASAIVELFRNAQQGVLHLQVLDRLIAQINDGIRRRAALATNPPPS